MTTRGKIIVGALLTIIVLAIGLFIWNRQAKAPIDALSEPITTVSYACNLGKTITAAYYNGTPKTSTDPNQPPTPGGSVALTLSDGRTMTLSQTLSADGARYATDDESFVFWDKGNGALVLEDNKQKTYIGCIKVAGNLTTLKDVKVYTNATDGFSVLAPVSFNADEGYRYEALGVQKSIAGIKFTIPASMTTGTNLSPDSYVSIESVPSATSCTAALFLGVRTVPQTVYLDNTDYSMATSSGAAAGNRYEEIVYALPGTNPCLAVRYFIHSSALENYPAGSKTAFDKEALIRQFDAIRDTVVVSQ